MQRYILFFKKNQNIMIFLTTVTIVIFTMIGYQKGIFTDQTKLKNFLLGCGFFAPLFFVLIQAVQVVIPILPGAIGCVYGVVFWGAWEGFLLNYIGICAGSLLAFLIARQFDKNFVKMITGKKFYEKYSRYLLKENQFEKIFAIAIFLPVAPDDFLCYLAGLSKMTIKKFIMIILLGKPAALFCYSMGLYSVIQNIFFQ